MKDNKIYRALWLVSGILLIAAGIFSLMNPASTLLSVAFLLGLVLVVSGGCDILFFWKTHDLMFGAGWVLLDGVFTLLVGVLLLCNRLLAAAALPYIFGMWIIISGLTRSVHAFDLKKLGFSRWGWLLAFGILSMAAGVLSFLNPVIAAVAIGVLVGVFFLLQGVSSLSMWFYTKDLPF